jgi:3-oxoacyl-[acyl-carrier protein] reductase
MDLNVRGKVAMVAGASRGMGYAVARLLAAEGARVSIAARNEATLKESAVRIAAETKSEVLPFTADLHLAGAIDHWASATVERFGGVDLLFANTGGPPSGSALSFDDNAWKDAHELLVLSSLRMARAVVPSMKTRGGGSIVFNTSTSIREPISNLALSNVERPAVAALSKTLAQELAPFHIRVNVILPGRIDTDRVRSLDALRAGKEGVTPEEQKARTEKTIALGRYGTVDEFAKAAVFLLSDAASYVTGASLLVDGGLVKGVV